MNVNRVALVIALLLSGCGPADIDSPSANPPPELVEPERVDYLDQNALLNIDKASNHAEIIELIDQYRSEALRGVEPDASVRTKLLHLNWYIHAHFESAAVSPYSLLEVLKRRHANCTASSTVMQLMARRLGIPSRTVGIAGIPVQDGHTTAEFLWDGKWHFIDPTFGAFITSDGTLEGEILSIDTIMKHRSHIARNTFYPQSAGRLGWLYSTAKPGSLAEMYSLTQVVMQAGGNYSLFLQTTSGAVPYDKGYVMNTIYHAEMGTAPTFSFGSDDGSGDDVALHQPVSDIPYDYDGSGMSFIGRWDANYGPLTCTQSHIVSGIRPGETITFTVDAVGQTSSWLDVKVRKGEILSSHYSGTRATFQIKAFRDDLVLSMTDLLQDKPHFTRLDYFKYTKP